jgi:hypothetical protein
MMNLSVNWWAVLLAGVTQMAVGAVWYSPGVFGKVWAKLVGFTQADMEQAKQKGMANAYVLTFIGALLGAFVLANVINLTNSVGAVAGALAGFWLWLGFLAPAKMGRVLWENKSKELFFLDAGHALAGMLVMGVILGVW